MKDIELKERKEIERERDAAETERVSNRKHITWQDQKTRQRTRQPRKVKVPLPQHPKRERERE